VVNWPNVLDFAIKSKTSGRPAGWWTVRRAGSGAALAAGLLAGVLPALAAEHITLKNGFDLLCDHRELQGSHVRLFLSKSESNFLDVDAAEIASAEWVPDPPPAAPVLAAASAASVPEHVPDAAELHQMVTQAGGKHNLDVDLLESVIRAESGGHIRAVSRTGARGLMQLMPGTAEELGVADSFAPDQNISGGTAYLNSLLERYHDNLALALAAYNAGPAAVDKYHGIPPYRETRSYVARVIHEFNRRKTLAAQAARAHVTTAALAMKVGQ
jgi:hypothetical protein